MCWMGGAQVQAGGIFCLLLIRNIADLLACLNPHKTMELVGWYLITVSTRNRFL
jgi:hypothetical protein